MMVSREIQSVEHQTHLIEQAAKTETLKASLPNRSLVTPDGWDNQVIQHSHQVHVGLQVAFNVLQHAESNMQTLHVNNNLLEHLGLGLFLVKWLVIFTDRSFGPSTAAGIITDF
jgi:hypothetical protein